MINSSRYNLPFIALVAISLSNDIRAQSQPAHSQDDTLSLYDRWISGQRSDTGSRDGSTKDSATTDLHDAQATPQELTAERQHLELILRSTAVLLNPKTPFIERVRVYCRSQNHFLSIAFGSATVEEVEIQYARILNQPSAPNPYVLHAAQEAVYGGYRNMNDCQNGIINGAFYGMNLPTDVEERAMALTAKTRIEEIDNDLASRK
jgi:hypothetical protein